MLLCADSFLSNLGQKAGIITAVFQGHYRWYLCRQATIEVPESALDTPPPQAY